MAPTSLPATNAAQSVAAWVKLNVNPSSGQQYIVSMWDAPTSSGISFGMNAGQLQAWAWGPRTLVSTSTPPSLGVWHHVAYTYDGTTHKLYIDGALVCTSTAAPNAHAVTRAQLGAYNSGGSFNGGLDDIRIYNAALTATQVANLAAGNASDGTTAPPPPPPSGGACSGVAAYVTGTNYAAGARAQNGGNLYQCQPYPNSGWCGQSAAAYAPGTGSAWTSAWTLVSSCN